MQANRGGRGIAILPADPVAEFLLDRTFFFGRNQATDEVIESTAGTGSSSIAIQPTAMVN